MQQLAPGYCFSQIKSWEYICTEGTASAAVGILGYPSLSTTKAQSWMDGFMKVNKTVRVAVAVKVNSFIIVCSVRCLFYSAFACFS